MRLTESLMAAFDAANDSTYRPLRKELPNLMISGMQHVLLVSIKYLHIVLLNKVKRRRGGDCHVASCIDTFAGFATSNML